MITRKSQLLLNFFSVRVIVNGKDIYELRPGRPRVISVSRKSQLVATDGFHISQSLEIFYDRPKTYHLKITCAIDNNQLVTGFVLMILFGLVGALSNILLLKVFSFFPVLYFLFWYYGKRKEFLRIMADNI